MTALHAALLIMADILSKRRKPMQKKRTTGQTNHRVMLSEQEKALLPFGYRIMHGDHEIISYPANSSIRIWRSVAESDHYDTHYHSAVEVIMCLKGHVQIDIPHHSYQVMAGEVLFIPSAMPHSLRMDAGSARNLFLFEVDYLLSFHDFLLLAPMCASPIHIVQDSPLSQPVRHSLDQIIQIYHSDDPLKNMVMYTHLLEIYVMLGHEFLVSSMASEGLSVEKRFAYLELLQHVIEYVNQHLAEDLPLEKIASEAGFSKYHFIRLFKKLTGETFHQYLCKQRISRAESLMRQSDLSVLQIAMRTGFNSIATFNRIYKDMRGMTPSQYRSLYRDQHMGA